MTHPGDTPLVDLLAELVHGLPDEVVTELAARLEAVSADDRVEDAVAAMVWQPGARPRVEEMLVAWSREGSASPGVLGAMTRAAAVMDRLHRRSATVELVGSGPAPQGPRLRAQRSVERTRPSSTSSPALSVSSSS